ncbi:MAG: DUF2652 domain-containing protein [Chloroflexota bacterium]
MVGPGSGIASGALVLADISGYTGFLEAVTTAHADDLFGGAAVPAAYPLISTLLDGIIERLIPPFRLAKLEGDAVFAYGVAGDDLPRGGAVLECMAACYAGFRSQLASARELWSCQCDACVRVGSLDLKFVLHAGSFVIQSIGGGRELAGPDVVVAHRLLKNQGAQVLGTHGYALATAAAVQWMGMPDPGWTPLTETLDGGRSIEVRLVALG